MSVIFAPYTYAQQDSLNLVYERGELIVGTVFEAGHFQQIQDAYRGLDVDLSHAFARALGVKLKFVPFINQHDLLTALKNQRIDIAAAPNLVMNTDLEEFKIGPIYSKVALTLISPKDTYPPNQLARIKQPIVVSENSNFDSLLHSLRTDYPHLIWTTVANANPHDIATSIKDGRFTHGLVRSEHVQRLQHYFPTLTYTALNLPPLPVSWLLNAKSNDNLAVACLEFFAHAQQSGLIAASQTLNQFDSPISAFFTSQSFIQDYQDRLPQYIEWFKTYSQSIDWTLLAAISYQTSHWSALNDVTLQPSGLMGLHASTTDLSSPALSTLAEQSIKLGARRLNVIYQQLPKRIEQSERPWFAVAAYYLGMAHIERARSLTRRAGGNPDIWLEVKSNLIKLESSATDDPDTLGYAPGLDALQFVENVRKYHDILTYLEQGQASVF